MAHRKVQQQRCNGRLLAVGYHSGFQHAVVLWRQVLGYQWAAHNGPGCPVVLAFAAHTGKEQQQRNAADASNCPGTVAVHVVNHPFGPGFLVLGKGTRAKAKRYRHTFAWAEAAGVGSQAGAA